MELRSYECSIDGQHWSIWNAASRGEAKAQYYRSILSDCGIPYIAARCRVLGLPFTSTDFVRNAKYRGIEFAYCGMRVKTTSGNGFIVGHNSSANLDVLFVDGTFKGQRLNCHPNHEIVYYDKKGNILADYTKQTVPENNYRKTKT